MAAMLKLAALPASTSDDDVRKELVSVAQRYLSVNVLGNLPEGARARARDSLHAEVSFDRSAGTVVVAAKADLGGTLLAKRFFGYDGPEGGIGQRAGIEAARTTTELVLAIDSTGSMKDEMPGGRTRMEVVRAAALDLIDVLKSRDGAAPLAIGLVPWTFTVQLGPETREAWERDGRAVYLRERYYPFPLQTATRSWCSANRKFPCTGPGTTSAVPAKPAAWRGCVDYRSFDDPPESSPGPALPLALSTVTPREAPFAMAFWSAQMPRPIYTAVAYECATEGGVQNRCYSGEARPLEGQFRIPPQYLCRRDDTQTIVPLTTDIARVRAAVSALPAGGSATYSTLGVVWGTRLLSPSWREAWGGGTHPMESTDGGEVRKVLVLLTDGQDNHWDRAAVEDHRARACAQAKAAGIVIFTIAAMDKTSSDPRPPRRTTQGVLEPGGRPGGALHVREQRHPGRPRGRVRGNRPAAARHAAPLLAKPRRRGSPAFRS